MEYTITPQYHEKKGTEIYVLRLLNKVDRDTFTELSQLAKKHKGYYSSYRGVNGFVFKTEDAAESFGEEIVDMLMGNGEETEEVVIEEQEQSVDLEGPMDLPDTLRQIILTEGSSIIEEVRLVNILDDYKVFSDRKFLKNVLRILIQEKQIRVYPLNKWNEHVDKKVDKISKEYGWDKELISFIFSSISYGLSYSDTVPCFCEANKEEVKHKKSAVIQKRKKVKASHLKFKGIDITGNPMVFSEAMMAQGFDIDVWCDDFFTMAGAFAGVSNCKLWIHFEPRENTVYRVKVEFPWYQNRERVKKDYKKLKKSLHDLYGKPICEHEDWSQDWCSTYNVPTGIIKLICFPGNCPQVTIDYYDGYYDTHHGEIIDEIVKLDL